MRARRSLVALSVNILLVLLVTAPGRAHAQDLPPLPPLAPVAPVTARLDGPPIWQRLALGLSVGAAAIGLVVGVGAKVAESQKIREFNDYRRPDAGSGPFQLTDVCTVGAPNAGPPGCAQMLSDANRARRLSVAGFAGAGTFVLTAIVLALVTGEDDEPPPSRAGVPMLSLVRF